MGRFITVYLPPTSDVLVPC